MGINLFYRAILAALILSFPSSVMAFDPIDQTVIFAKVAQGHHGDNSNVCHQISSAQLMINGNGIINGTGGARLDYCSSNDGSGLADNSCDNGTGGVRKCTIDGSDIRGLNLTGNNAFLSSSGAGGGYGSCNTGEQLTLGGNGQSQFSNVSLYSACTLTLSATQNEYRFNTIAIGGGATLVLPEGDYWVDSFTLNQDAKVILQGNVRIFIKQQFELNGSKFNENNAASALIIGYSNIQLNSDAVLNGRVYSDATLSLNNNSIINGRVTSRYLVMSSGRINDYVPVLQCFNDTFSQSALSSDWATKVLGSSTPPSLVQNRLRITPALANQATASTFQRLFPAENNLVTVEFDYYAWSPSSGTGGDGVAVILSDASVTPQPGSFGGSLGYAQRDDGTPGFKGGWLGVGLDEYGNFSNPNEGKVGGPGFRAQSITLRGSEAANYKYLAGTAANLNPRIDVRGTSTAQPNHKYRIKVDSTITGQAWVSVERDVRNGNGYQALVPAFNARAISGQGAVPKDFYLSFTGSTGGANNNHEIDNFKVCALQSRPIGQQVHHFEFDYSASPLTCKAETMTVRACANADCSQRFTDPVNAQLSINPNTNGAWYVGGVNSPSLNFVNGLATAALRYNVTAPAVTIGVSSSIPSTVAGSNTLCRKGSGLLNTASCTLAFADSGFIFDVPDKLANKPTSINISAVRKSNSSLECVPAFSDATKNVGFWSSYITPSSIPAAWQQATTIKGNPLSPSPTIIGKTESTRTPIPVKFTNGVASVEVNYPDAGKVELSARLDGVGEDMGLVMIGSDQFVSVPAGLCVKPVDASASCPSANMSCNAYRKAGQSFGMTVQAMAWEKDGDPDFCSGNLPTPNFSDAQMKLASKVVAPSIANGGLDGALGVASYSHSAQANNLNTISNQTISEVGVFQIAAQASPNYLGTASSLNIPIGYSANIGRFVPDRFLVSNVSVIPACGGFSYMDQLFPMSMELSALNIAGDITKNYFPPFSLATAKLVGENNNNGVDLQSRLSALPIKADSWNQGVATVDASYQANFSRVTPNVATNLYQDGPFELLDIGVQLMDNDPRPNGLYSYVASPDMDAASTGTCTNCNAKKISTQTLRHGRVVMDNTYGPETEILRMPTRAEYWNGSSWALNTADNCTTAVYALGSQVDHSALGYNFDPDLVAGQSVVRSGGTATFQAGQFELLWQAVTTSGLPYRGQVTAPLDVPTWLEWYWNWNGVSPTAVTEPRASAYFGRYRGHDKIIYWREVN